MNAARLDKPFLLLAADTFDLFTIPLTEITVLTLPIKLRVPLAFLIE